jgi:hypothetical protein
MSTAFRDFADVLLKRGIIRREQLAEARQLENQTGARLADILIRLGYTTTQEVLMACAESLGLAFLDLTDVIVPPAILELMPESVARENVVLPLSCADGVLTVAVCDPTDRETLDKLQFILNRAIRLVLSPREQIVEAINRLYGPMETECVDSMLAEFTDTAIDFSCTSFGPEADLGTPDEGAMAAPEPVAACFLPASPLVDRQATVRYYHRMNPERMFPLLVILSRKAIQEVAKRGVGQGQSQTFQVAEDSLVEIEPILPGCGYYPPKEMVRVGPGEVCTTFWVVPHVLGRVMQARVVVRQEGETLAEVPLEMRVVKQSLTAIVGILSLVLPFCLLLLKHFHLDFESQLEDGFGLYAQVANWLLQSLTPESLTGLLLAGTAALYFWLRPRKRDVFWDVKTVGPEEQARPRPAPATTPREKYRDDQPSLLSQADRCFADQDYAAALACYDRARKLGTTKAVHYFRASLAAHKTGDTARALRILQQAETVLPRSEMKGPLWYNMGCFAARLGRVSEALCWLNRAVDTGYSDAEKIRSDPDLEPLHWHAGFKRLLLGIGG